MASDSTGDSAWNTNMLMICRSRTKLVAPLLLAVTFGAILPKIAAADNRSSIRKFLVPDVGSRPDWPVATPSDTTSIRAVVSAFYAAISVKPGERIDRTRLRSLFVPDGRIAMGVTRKANGSSDIILLSPDRYADVSDLAARNSGFSDRLLANHIERFGAMAHVFSSYESRYTAQDSKPFAHGIKSFELLNSDGRWYIIEVAYRSTSPQTPLPESLLHDREE